MPETNPAQMTRGTTAEHIVSAVVPGQLHTAQDSVQPLPVSDLPELPRDGTMLYRIASVDLRGRVADSTIVQALGWSPSEPIQFGTWHGAVACNRSSTGSSALTKRAHISIPSTLRRWCGIASGDRVLLAAAPTLDVLVIYTMAALDHMVLGYHEFLTRTDQP